MKKLNFFIGIAWYSIKRTLASFDIRINSCMLSKHQRDSSFGRLHLSMVRLRQRNKSLNEISTATGTEIIYFLQERSRPREIVFGDLLARSKR
jgi:predicted MarR family transcription regulator